MKITILNHCSHNKGDNSVLYYLCNSLHNLNNDISFTISSSEGSLPFWWPFRNSVAVSWPGGKIFRSPHASTFNNYVRAVRFLALRKIIYPLFIFLYSKNLYKPALLLAKLLLGNALISEIRTSDKIFCTGGHHISNVLERDCINPQLVALCLAELLGKPAILWSQSIGPITGAPGFVKAAIKKIFNSSRRILVRDEASKKCVELLSDQQTTIVPDSVFLAASTERSHDNTPATIICAIYTAGINDEEYLERYCKSWSIVAAALAQEGYDVVFVPMQYKKYGGDERPYLKLITELAADPKVTFIDADHSPHDTINVYSQAACIVGHKTHSIIYGLALGIPTFAIAYHEKTRYFMDLFQKGDMCIDTLINNENQVISSVINIAHTNNPSDKATAATFKSALTHQLEAVLNE